MPVQIVSNNDQTDVNLGQITVGDLQKIRNSFKDEVVLTALPPRFTISKRLTFYFTKSQLDELFSHSVAAHPNADTIEVAIAVQLPGSVIDCESLNQKVDNSNCLAVVISATSNDPEGPHYLVPYNDEEDYVLITGYKSISGAVDVPICCPGSHPPPPYS